MKIGDYLIAKDEINRTSYSLTFDNSSGKLLSASQKCKMIFKKNKKYFIKNIRGNIITISYDKNNSVGFSLINDNNNHYEYYKNIFFDIRMSKLNKIDEVIF